jgi:hypothetical protein
VRWKKGEMEHETRKMEDGRRIGATMARFEVVKVREEKRREEKRREIATMRPVVPRSTMTSPHDLT